MNISSQGWRQHYANYVRRMCYDYGYDGVFADDVWSLFWKDPWTVPPEDVTDYPDWHEQMIDFISQVRSRISPKLIIINGPNNGDYVDAADGKMEENFAFKSISGQTPLDNVNALYEISGRGKYYLASPFTLPDDTEENMLFALGCFLLGVNGPRAYFSWRNVWSEPSHGSYPQFDEAEDLGFPVADYYSYQNVWARDFENGWVLVNLSYNPYTVDLEGTYETLEGEVVTEITMEGHTGVILTEI